LWLGDVILAGLLMATRQQQQLVCAGCVSAGGVIDWHLTK
jgi:hypothetical protein